MDPINMLAPAGATRPIGRTLTIADDTARGGGFGDVLAKAIDSVNAAQKEAGAIGRRFSIGDPSVSLEETMIVMAKSGIQFSALVQVRNRLMQEYNTIMNMPV